VSERVGVCERESWCDTTGTAYSCSTMEHGALRVGPFVATPRSYVQRDRAPPEDMFMGEPSYRQFIQATLALRDATPRVRTLSPLHGAAAHRFSAQPFLDTA
jgi:hypothetical protein